MEITNPDIISHPAPGMSLDEQNPEVVGRVSEVISQAQEEYSKEAMDKAEAEAARAYFDNPDPNVPDFDVEDNIKKIEECSYLELPIWKKSFEDQLENLIAVNLALSDYPTYLKKLEALADDPQAGFAAREQLDMFNKLQNQGISMEKQVNAYTVKYDVNKKFLQDMIKKIDDRMKNELEEVNNAPTSKKNMMTYELVKKQRESILNMGVDERNKRVLWATENMMTAYMQSNTIDWVNEAIRSGHKPATIVSGYKRRVADGTLEEYVTSTFRLDLLPRVVGIEEDHYNFLMYWLTYVSTLNDNKSTVPNLKIQKFREHATLLIRNLNDVGINAYDLIDTDYTENEDGIVSTYKVADPSEDMYEDIKKNLGIIYLNRVKSLADQIYALAFK